MLLNKERKYLISKFPKVKPFYEKTLHNRSIKTLSRY